MAATTVFDHLFVIVMTIAIPLHSRYAFPGLLDDIRKRGEPARVAAYRNVIVTFASAACVVAALWVVFDRDWTLIGFRAGEPESQALAFGIAVIFAAYVILPIRKIALSVENGDGDASKLTEHMGELVLIMPKTRREETWFNAVSVNAGITEEVIFRGYLIWYLLQFVSVGWAAFVAILAFGLAHAYQGLRQLPGILMTSAVAVAAYLVSESLVVPIIMHIFVDAFQGHYIARMRRALAASG